jgi:O-antigen/teichoic acid export membrane protein
MKDNSIRSRFAFTVGANLFRALLSFVTGLLIGRYLGPTEYGNMSFLLGTFVGLRHLLDMGSSFAFFTFLSQKPPTKRFVTTFLTWLLIQFLIPIFFIGIIFPYGWITAIWHENGKILVLLAFAATFMQNSVWPVLQNAGESQRQTKRVQSIGVLVSVVHCISVVIFWWTGILGLYAIFSAIVIEYLLASVIANKRFKYSTDPLNSDVEAGLMLKKYINFCLPLVPYAICNFAFEFSDKWLLQTFGGSIEQAFYAVGNQLSSVALIATTSIIRILWKEVAEAHHQGDHVRTGVIYRRVSRMLFFVGCVIAGFLIPWTKDLLNLLLGSAYIGGTTTMAIMLLYPVHQSMGQIGGTMLYATERTRIQVTIGIIFLVSSIIVSYFMLADKSSAVPGLALGSVGLALKMVIMQFIQVNATAIILARIFKWSFDWIYQPINLISCLGIGWLSHYFAVSAISNMTSIIWTMVVGGVVYCLLIFAFIFAMPSMLGTSREELLIGMKKMQNFLRRATIS